MAYFSKHYHDPGTAPGTLVAASDHKGPVTVHLMDYTDDHVEEVSLGRAVDGRVPVDPATMTGRSAGDAARLRVKTSSIAL